MAPYIPAYITLIMLLIILLGQNRMRRSAIMRNTKKRRQNPEMTNELLKSYIGKTCTVSSGSFGETVKGEITRVEDNWLEVTTKKAVRLFNADYITGIIVENKQ